ncbi:hypothetical protein BsWGS_16484 [Bradybaena similaris]
MNAARHALLLAFATWFTSTTASPFCPYDVPPTRPLPGKLFTTQGCTCDDGKLDCYNLLELPELNHERFMEVVTSATFEEGQIALIPSNRLPANLTAITFRENPISFIAEDAFDSSASTLRVLIFSKAAFTGLPSALLRLPNISTFSVSNTPVVNVEQISTFPFASKLVNLDISYLGLSVMPNLRNLTSLSNISLGYNNIKCVPSDMYPMQISSIDLQFNQLNEITNTSFIGYPNLKYLRLNNNPVTIISSSAFISLGSLETLQLSSTLIKTLPLDLPALTSLDLLDVSASPIECDCPHNSQLVLWHASYRGRLFGTCTDGRDINDYLTGSCESPSTTTCTITTTMTTTTVTKDGGDDDACPTVACNVMLRYSCLLVLCLMYFYTG